MKYVCKRILMLLVTMVIVSLLAFAAFELIHGSAAEIMLGTQATPERVAELEAELGKFLRKPGIVTFGTGYQSNVGIISALVDRHDYVICDRENHASIYAGCQMSYGKMLRYRHSDMEELEKCLQRVPEKNGALIVTDGVFSMGGDIAKLPEICALAKKYGARVMVDDAHGLGVLGQGGRGTASYFGLEDQVDCLLPALSQAGIGRDCLKAVLTPHNRTWTAVKLYQELLREHQAMNGR